MKLFRTPDTLPQRTVTEKQEVKMNVNFIGFENYRTISNEIRDKLYILQMFSQKMHMDGLSRSLEELLEKTRDDVFKIAVVGEFKRGKSTLINALLGEAFLPADVLPTTAALNQLTYSPVPGVTLLYKDGRQENIKVEQLVDYVTKLTEEAEERAEQIQLATIAYPTNYCKNNVDIIDTPGLNDDAAMTNVTLSVLPAIDAALFVIMANSPFSEYERDFLCNKILSSDLGRVIFVVTGIDRLDEEDVDRVLENIRKRIQEYVLEKAEKVMGKDSPEFIKYQSKIGELRIFGFSAKQALKAKKNNDQALLAASKFPEFENELERFLTEERGLLTLKMRGSKLASAAAEIARIIEMRLNSLEMSCNEFQQKHSNARQQIARIRDKRQQELTKVSERADATFAALKPQIASFRDELIQTALAVVRNAEITSDMILENTINNTRDELFEKVKDAIENQSRLLSERIERQIGKAVGEEAERLYSFGDEFYKSISNIRNDFTSKNSLNNDVLLNSLLLSTSVITMPVLSPLSALLSGASIGFREGGWKGMLLGSGMSIGTGAGIFYGLGSAAVLLGGWTFPVALGVSAISSFSSVLVSRWGVRKFFGQNKINDFKEAMCQYLQTELENMSNEIDMEKKTGEQVKIAFDALERKVHQETESILSDLEHTLNDIEQQLAEHRGVAEYEKSELKNFTDVLSEINIFSQKLNGSLLEVGKH